MPCVCWGSPECNRVMVFSLLSLSTLLSKIFLDLHQSSSILCSEPWAVHYLRTKPMVPLQPGIPPSLTYPQDSPSPRPFLPPDHRLLCPCILSPPVPCPHSPWGIGSLGLSLDGGPRAPQEGFGSSTHAVVVVAVEWGTIAWGREGAMAPWGGSTSRGTQVVEPTGAGDGQRPMWKGGCTGWSSNIRKAAVGKGGGSAPRLKGKIPTPASRRELFRGPRSQHQDRMRSSCQDRTCQPQGLPGNRGQWLARATHRSEASSLPIYSSRMLVSMLEGSRAPLMSWPIGQGELVWERLPTAPQNSCPALPASAG